jgi:hypothetical protein
LMSITTPIPYREEVEKIHQYGIFHNFKQRDTISLSAVEETKHYSQQKNAAMIKQLSTNPDKYVQLRKVGWHDDQIPGWMARLPEDGINVLNQQLQTSNVSDEEASEE